MLCRHIQVMLPAASSVVSSRPSTVGFCRHKRSIVLPSVPDSEVMELPELVLAADFGTCYLPSAKLPPIPGSPAWPIVDSETAEAEVGAPQLVQSSDFGFTTPRGQPIPQKMPPPPNPCQAASKRMQELAAVIKSAPFK